MPSPKSLLIATLAFATLLVLLALSVFIGARVYVPREVEGYVSGVSSKMGVRVGMSTLKYDVFRGLYGEGISIARDREPASPFLTVRKVTFKHDLLQSLLNSKIEIRATLVAPLIDISSGKMGEVVHLVEELTKEAESRAVGKGGPRLRVELESLSIVDAEIRLREGPRVHIRDAAVRFTKGERGMEASLMATASSEGGSFFVKAKVSQGDRGIHAVVQAFSPSFIPKAPCPGFMAGCEARVLLSALFEIGEGVKAKGYLNLNPTCNTSSGGEPPSGRVDFDVVYDRLNDMTSINELMLYLEGVGGISLHGSAGSLTTHDRYFELKGASSDIEVHPFSKWLIPLSGFDVSGLSRVEEIAIRGRDGEITWEAGIAGRGVEAAYGGILVSGGAWEINTRGVLRENALYAASGEGRFYAEGASSPYGSAKSVLGSFDFTIKHGEKTLNVKNLRFSALGGSATAEIKYEAKGGGDRSRIELTGNGFDLGMLSLKSFGIEERVGGLVKNLRVSLDGSITSGWKGRAGFSLSGLSVKEKGLLFGVKGVSLKTPLYVSFHDRLELSSSGIGFSGLKGAGTLLIEKGVAQGRLTYARESGLGFDAKVRGEGASFFGVLEGASGFEASLRRDAVPGSPISGKLSLEGGKLFGRGFSVASAGFYFVPGELGLRDVAIEKKGLGAAKSKSIDIAFKGGRARRLSLDGVSLHGMGGRLRLDGGGADIHLGSGGRWYGKAKFASGMVPHAWFEDAAFSLEGGRDSVSLSSISAKVNEGVLEGSLALRTGEVRGSMRYGGGGFVVGEGFVSLGGVDLNVNLKYSMDRVLFPSGTLVLRADGVVPEGYGEGLSYDAGIEFTGDGKTLSLSAKVKNRASGDEAGLWARALLAGDEVLIEGNVPELNLGNFYGVIAPALFPMRIELTRLAGSAALDLKASLRWGGRAAKVYSSEGSISVKGLSLNGRLRGMEVSLEDINGTIPISSSATRSWVLSSVPQGYLEGDRESFGRFMAHAAVSGFYGSPPSISADRLRIGILDLIKLEGRLEVDPERVVLSKMHSQLSDGEFLAEGSYPIGKEGRFDLAFLINEVSLKQFTEASGMPGYITGRVSGVGIIRGNAGFIESAYGSFSLWSVKAKGEPRLIGQAFLEKLGIGRLFIRSPRKYDRGEVYGRISRGIITFKELNISHTSFGVTDLAIRVDPVRNSIAITQLLSVMRETARRVNEGGIELEIKK